MTPTAVVTCSAFALIALLAVVLAYLTDRQTGRAQQQARTAESHLQAAQAEIELLRDEARDQDLLVDQADTLAEITERLDHIATLGQAAHTAWAERGGRARTPAELALLERFTPSSNPAEWVPPSDPVTVNYYTTQSAIYGQKGH